MVMNKVNRTMVHFADGSWLELVLHADFFRLTKEERALVTALTDLLQQFKEQAKGETDDGAR